MEDQKTQEPLPQTFGQKAVRCSFNPSGSSAVDRCKQLFADAVDQMNDLRNDPNASGEVKRLASIAITETVGAKFRAVDALTWVD